jgi:hypothetical protein
MQADEVQSSPTGMVEPVVITNVKEILAVIKHGDANDIRHGFLFDVAR